MLETVAVIFPAGGNSSRFGAENKLLCNLNGIPVFCHAIRNFSQLLPYENMILSLNINFIDDFRAGLDKCFPGNNVKLVPGGKTRTESVLNALKVLPDHIEFIAVHDAARPLADSSLFLRCLDACKKYGAAVAVHPIVDTVKLLDAEGLLTSGNVDRDTLRGMETPQIFRADELIPATEKAVEDTLVFTDDAAAVEHFCGRRAYPVENRECNLKITHQADLVSAEILLARKA